VSDRPRTAPAPEATQRRSWWPGWIWSVPLAALGIGVWLLVRFLTQGGTDVTIAFVDASGIKPKDTSVEYRGMEIGTVTAVSLAKDGGVEVTANIDDAASDFLKAGTVFWLRGAKPSLSDPSSLGAVLSGPTIVMDPGDGAPAKRFRGIARKPAVPRDHGPAVRFRVAFDDAVGDLSKGDAVDLRGFPVGEVDTTDLHYDATTGAIETPVTVLLYPRLFHVEGDGDAAFRATIDRLVDEGLRAKLAQSPPLLGSHRVTLEMTPGAPPAAVRVVDGVPELPSAPGGGLETIVDRVKDVPIDRIAQNALDITKHVDEIVSSPTLKDSVTQLNASLRDVRRMVGEVTPQVDRIVQSLRDTAADLRQTARAADRTLAGTTSQTGVTDTLREVKEAARAIRSLADYLDRHPESLIAGRSGS
jgi:paraquat-inducible protein B